MREDACVGRIIRSVRTVGGGAEPPVTDAHQRPLHMCPQRRTGPCTHYRFAKWSAVMTVWPSQYSARRTLAACNAARNSEL